MMDPYYYVVYSVNVDVGYLLFYACDTNHGSSGAPVYKIVNKQLRVIAVHRASWDEKVKFNFGTLITEVLRHVRNEPITCEQIGLCT